MPQAYSNPDDAADPHRLPDVEVFQLTAEEHAEMELGRDPDALHEMARLFPLWSMNSRDRSRMLDAYVATGIEGGWFYHYCLPGCLPDGEPMGPYPTFEAALEAAREDAAG